MKYLIYNPELEEFLHERLHRMLNLGWGCVDPDTDSILRVKVNALDGLEEHVLYMELLALESQVKSLQSTIIQFEQISQTELERTPRTLDQTVIVPIIDETPDFSVSWSFTEFMNEMDAIH